MKKEVIGRMVLAAVLLWGSAVTLASAETAGKESDPSQNTQDAAVDIRACFAKIKGLRWRLLADKLEAKLQSHPNLSVDARQAWEADIAAVRDADAKGLSMPVSPDPEQPMRYLQRLAMDEQVVLNRQYAAESKILEDRCAGQGKISAREVLAEARADHSGTPDISEAQKKALEQLRARIRGEESAVPAQEEPR